MLDKVTKEQVKKALTDLKDPEEQMEALMRLLELQQDDLKTRTEIASHIQVTKYSRNQCVSFVSGTRPKY